MRKDTATLPDPTTAITLFGSRLPPMPLIAAPINGNTGISQSRSNAFIALVRTISSARNDLLYHFSKLLRSTFKDSRFRNMAMTRASPTAASAAATTSTKKTKICPLICPS